MVRLPGLPLSENQSKSVYELFQIYETELVHNTFADPLGTRISFFDRNFPKLIQLRLKLPNCPEGLKVRASRFLEEVRSGSFDEQKYQWDAERSGTRLWIPDVIVDPDSIHKNAHVHILGDIVYMKRYDKSGEPHKLVFTYIDHESGARIVVTSFLTPQRRLHLFLNYPAIWQNKKATV